MSFSERYGYKPVRDIIQLESIDDALRNGIWSLLKLHCWDEVRRSTGVYKNYYLSSNPDHEILCNRLWFDYFKKPLDLLSNDWSDVLAELRNYFFACEWYEAYDFIEFVSNNYKRHQFDEKFPDACNLLFEKELAAYRFIDGVITRITSEEEILEIEQALEQKHDPVKNHLRRSLELLSDRSTPDYRNSIKESISAVESYVNLVLGEDKGTLGKLLKKLESEIGLHPALKSAFSKLYGYSSDEGGIRHAMTELDSIDFTDAKFMLVVCSAFINFVEGKNSLNA